MHKTITIIQAHRFLYSHIWAGKGKVFIIIIIHNYVLILIFKKKLAFTEHRLV